MRKIAFYCIVATLLLASSTNLYAANRQWIGGDGNWNTAGNWNGGAVPGAGDVALFDDPAYSGVTVTMDVSPTVDNLYVGTGAGTEANPIEVTITGGGNALATTGLVGICVGNGIGHGKLTILDGTYNIDRYYIVGWTNTSTGVVDQQGGTINVNPGGGGSEYFILADQSNTKGTYNLSGGTLNVGEDSRIGLRGTGIMTVSQPTATPTVFSTQRSLYVGEDNGTLTVTGGTVSVADQIQIAAVAGSTGTMNVSGGTVEVTTNHLFIGTGGQAALTQTGGTIDIQGGATVVGESANLQCTYSIDSTTEKAVHNTTCMIVGQQGALAQPGGFSGILTIDGADTEVNITNNGAYPNKGRFYIGGSVTTANRRGKVEQLDGTVTVAGKFIMGNSGTAGGTYLLNAGRIEVGGEAGIGWEKGGATPDANIDIQFSSGTVAASSTAWEGAVVATLTGDGDGNDATFEVNSLGNAPFWSSALTGTGGLQIRNLAATPYTMPAQATANYNYTGATSIIDGVLDLRSGGQLTATAKLIAGTDDGDGAALPFTPGATGTLLMSQNDFTQAASVTDVKLDGGTFQMENAGTGTLTQNLEITANGATLESVTAAQSWTVNPGAATIDPAADLTLAGAGDGDLQTGFTGNSVTKTGTGSWTLSSANTYAGNTTITAGTLELTGTNASTNFDVAAGATLTLGAPDLLSAPAISFNLTDTSTLNGLNQTMFTDTNPTITLLGNYAYNTAFLASNAFANKNVNIAAGSSLAIDSTLTSTGNLVIADGAALTITVTNANDGQDAGVAALTTNQLTVRQEDLTIDTSGYTAVPGEKFTVYAGDWLNATGPWSAAVDGKLATYQWDSGLLYGTIAKDTVLTGSNTEATGAILAAYNPTGDTATAQALLNAATTAEEKDQITQQFTPSMALAHAAQSVQTSSQLLQTVGQQIAAPWNSSYTSGVNILRANNGRRSCGSRTNLWFQSFGYAGEQAIKDDFAGYDNSGWGVVVGTDKALGPRTVLGLAYGYSQTVLNSTPFVTGNETPSSVNTEGHSLIGYAMIRSSYDTFLAFKAGSTWYAVDGVRRPFASDPSRIYTYNTDARTWYLQGTLGWQWLQRPCFNLTPKAKLAYYGYSQDAYQEVRPGLTPSSVDAYSNGYTQADLLLDSTLFVTQDLTLNVSAGYRGLIGADGAVLTSGADGVSYNVNGVSAAEHQFVLDAGTVFEIGCGALLITEYNFRTGQGSHLHGGTGTLVLTF